MRSPKRSIPAVLLFYLTFFSLQTVSGEAETAAETSRDTRPLPEAPAEEAAPELLALSLGDSEVSLFLNGFWKGTFSAGYGITLSPLGLSAASGESPFLFTQEADLTLSLWIRRKWFVEAGFLDDYAMNTYRAGYQGAEGEAVRYVGIGNTGLDFPDFPYLDLGGDSPASLGVYGRFGSGALNLHSIVRYDAASREERVFVGNRERSYSSVPVDAPLRGLSFVLPAENIGEIPVIYLEDAGGDIRGSDLRRWRRARSGEFAVSARYGIGELRSSAKGRVAVAYGPGKSSAAGYALGSYAGEGFLGEVQEFFADNSLNRYPQPGQEDSALTGTALNIPGTVELEGNIALVIYEPGTFSPFERQNRYRPPTSNAPASTAALVRVSSGEVLRDYEVVPVEALNALSELSENNLFEAGRAVELKKTGGQKTFGLTDLRSVESRWPLAGTYPSLYLPGTRGLTDDIALRFTNYGAPGAFIIGADAIPGSVQVYRGGLPDTEFTFNASGGEVTLKNPPGFNEVIRIRYLKKGSALPFGSLTAGIGVTYDPEGPFRSALALGLRWNISKDAYTEEERTSPGTVGLGAEAALDFDRLKAKVTLGLGFEQPDTTGFYRVAGMEGTERTLEIPASTAFISEAPADSLDPGASFSGLRADTRSALVYRNYQNPDILGSVSLLPVSSAAPVISGRNGPYPVKDPSVSRETLLGAEFTLTEEQRWTGFQVPLRDEADILEEAQEIGVPFRLYGFEREADIRIIVQFGALAAKDSGEADNPALITSREIYPDNHTGEGVLKLGRISLTGEDRRRLKDARFMRILILRSDTPGTATEVSGRVLTAPPYVLGAGFKALIIRNGALEAAPDEPGQSSVAAAEKQDIGLEAAYRERINRFHPENTPQRVLEASWKNLEAGESAGAGGKTGAIPLDQYQTLSFFFKAPVIAGAIAPDSSRLRVFIAGGPESISANEIALEADIPLSAFNPGHWSLVYLRYGGEHCGVYVGETFIPEGKLRYRPSGAGSPSNQRYAAVFLCPLGAGDSLQDGAFSLDEITLEDAAPAYHFNGGGSLTWRHPEALLSLGGLAIVEAVSLNTALESAVQGDPFTQNSPFSYAALTRSTLEFSLLGTRLSFNTAFAFLPNENSWSAGHEILRSWGPFTVSESFSLDPSDVSLNHRLSFLLNAPVRGRLEGNLLYRNQDLEQTWNAGLGIAPASSRPLGISIDADIQWLSEGEDFGPLDNYGDAWVKSWEPLIPDRGTGAKKRDIHGLLKIPLKLSPLGLEWSADGRSGFIQSSNSTKAETRSRLDLPFTLGEIRFLFRGERIFTRNLFYQSEDALSDGFRYYESLKDSWRLWLSLPFYSLFDPLLPDTLGGVLEEADTADITEYGLFSDGISFTLELPQNFGVNSLYFPSHIETRVFRNLLKKLDIPTDVLNINSALRFSSINIFGAFGAVPVFPFYQSEELNHTLEAQVAIPQNDLVSWKAQDEQRMTFYGFSGAELALVNAFTIGSSLWQESFTLEWTAPAPKSILGVFYLWLTDKIRDSNTWPALAKLGAGEFERLRKENLEILFEQGSAFQSAFILGHESIIRILGRLYFSTFIKLNCRQNYSTSVYSFTGLIGVTLNVSF
ncbi:MAG: hypothetical protein LBG76_05830 [Treponema sp.]|nr:hypothetical protein [Treponema sp.]